jgi:hypothetical protein
MLALAIAVSLMACGRFHYTGLTHYMDGADSDYASDVTSAMVTRTMTQSLPQLEMVVSNTAGDSIDVKMLEQPDHTLTFVSATLHRASGSCTVMTASGNVAADNTISVTFPLMCNGTPGTGSFTLTPEQ